MVSSNYSGTTLSGSWRLGTKLGEGACAQVYDSQWVGRDGALGSGGTMLYVAKVCEIPAPAKKGSKKKKTPQELGADTLYYESQCYNGFLRGNDRIPQVPFKSYGEDVPSNLRYLIMQRLGRDTEAAFIAAGSRWSPATVAQHGRQMLDALRQLHVTNKLVFVDVKPENFAFGHPTTAEKSKIFLLDFGLCTRWVGKGGKHKELEQSASPPGTPEYLSLACHGGASSGRRDDIESLGYILIHWICGGVLPWSGATSDADCLARKRGTSIEDLTKNCKPMARWITTCRSTAYDEAPSYEIFSKCLDELERCTPAATGGGDRRASLERRTSSQGAGMLSPAPAGGVKKRARKDDEVVEVASHAEKVKGKGSAASARSEKANGNGKAPARGQEAKGKKSAVEHVIDTEDEKTSESSFGGKRRSARLSTSPEKDNNVRIAKQTQKGGQNASGKARAQKKPAEIVISDDDSVEIVSSNLAGSSIAGTLRDRLNKRVGASADTDISTSARTSRRGVAPPAIQVSEPVHKKRKNSLGSPSQPASVTSLIQQDTRRLRRAPS